MQSLLILGRQPSLGLAELESLYGADTLTSLGRHAALLNHPPNAVAFDRLGGSIKLAGVLATLPASPWHAVEPKLEKIIQTILTDMPDGKIKLGLSTFGIKVSPKQLQAAGLSLKKSLRASGRSVRVVPNKSAALNSAQVLHNQLTSPTGIELVILQYAQHIYVARTYAEQDIDAYARRDQNRPKRDARVGMLPPKLAQVIVNLASGKIEDSKDKDQETTVLDPFCGTGVLLQEALLMGYNIYGTDIEPRMIDYTRQNINWLKETKIYTGTGTAQYDVTDATTARWSKEFDIVACETYLGKPLTSLPPRQVLDTIMTECDDIHDKFLHTIGSQITPGTRLCLAVPAWRTKNGFLHLKTLAKIEQLGYTRKKFVHVRDEELVYHRPDQTVARELVVLEKK